MSAEHTPGTAGELLDVVDAYDSRTGLVLPKSQIHAEGLLHRDMHVWIVHEGQLLQQQRHANKSIMPGAWDISAAGHVGHGEDYLSAAVRETEEELGLALPPERFMAIGKLAARMTIGNGSDQWVHKTIGENFVVVEPNLDLASLRLQASEVQGVRLYDIDRLERDVSAPETASRHAPHPIELWQLGIDGIRRAIEASR